MNLFGVKPGIAGPSRILAATYAHNQLYYQQSFSKSSLAKRWTSEAPFQSYYREAASGIVPVLKSVQALREAAAALRDPETSPIPRDKEETLRQVKQLVTAYNSVRGSLEEAKPYLNRSVKGRLDDATAGYENIGISKKADGTLALDEEKLGESLAAQFDQSMTAVAGKGGLADKLFKETERLEEVPPSSLLSPRFSLKQPFAVYQYRSLPGGALHTGLLFDGFF